MAEQQCKPIPQLTAQEIERFWSKVDKTPGHGPNGDCWIWKLGKDPDGYGRATIHKITYRTHRIAYLIEHGTDPADKLVLHSCDYPACCNGAHLRSGTVMDNNRDAAAKGRSASGDRSASRLYPWLRKCQSGDANWVRQHPGIYRGEANPNATLTAAQVVEIRSRYAAGDDSTSSIGKEYGVSRSTIHRVVTRQNWKTIQAPGQPLPQDPQCLPPQRSQLTGDRLREDG